MVATIAKKIHNSGVLKKASQHKYLSLAVAGFAVAIFSAAVWAFSYGPMVSVQPEQGSMSGGVAAVADAGASGGQSVQFGGGGGSGPVKPTQATVGPRIPVDTVVTPTQALTTLRNTGYLSGVTINGQFSLEGSDGVNWTIEDVRINSGSLYGLRTYRSGSPYAGTYAQRPVFRNISVVGVGSAGTGTSCGSVLAVNDVVVENADIYGCVDGIKAWNNVTINSSWIHDLDHPAGAHCDTVQIVAGTNNVFHGNRFDAYTGYSSDGSGISAPYTCSGALQTGTVTGDVQATWTNNWFAGGHYTLRGQTDATYNVSYTFHNNKFMRYGTSVALGLTNLDPNVYGPLYGNTATAHSWVNNIWEDTGAPVY